jgi:hypothetical protein
MKIGIFLCICEEDAIRWLDQLLPNLEAIGLPVSWYADHCSPETLVRLRSMPFTLAVHDEQVKPFSEQSKEIAFDALSGFDWAVQMDSDETWQTDAGELLRQALASTSNLLVRCPMVTMWEHEGKMMVRTDLGSQRYRIRIYNLAYRWHWADPVTNGPYAIGYTGDAQPFDIPVRVFHWGYSTPALRLMHKERWDRIYGSHIGRNPYGLWNQITDPNDKPVLENL